MEHLPRMAVAAGNSFAAVVGSRRRDFGVVGEDEVCGFCRAVGPGNDCGILSYTLQDTMARAELHHPDGDCCRLCIRECVYDSKALGKDSDGRSDLRSPRRFGRSLRSAQLLRLR